MTISLRLRITLLTTIFLSCMAVFMTACSIMTARASIVQPVSATIAQAVSIYNKTEIDSNMLEINEAVSYVHTMPAKLVKVEMSPALTLNGISSDTIAAKTVPLQGVLPQIVTYQQAFNTQSIFIMMLVVLFGSFLTYWMTGKALKPLAVFQSDVQNVNEHNLSSRLTLQSGKDEISALTTSFNHMLERLEKAFTAQRLFASNAAHELKTPLASMLASVEVLELGDEPTMEEMKDTLDVTKRNVHTLMHLVDELLHLTKDEILSTEKINLLQECSKVKEALLDACQAKHIRIQLPYQNAYVNGNRQLLYRMLYNIIENAVKYGLPDSLIAIVLSEEKDTVKVNIANYGETIPKQEQPHLFDAFYRVDPSRNKAVKGFGLGLAIVKMIVEKHKGTIAVKSAEGVTNFTVQLPIQS